MAFDESQYVVLDSKKIKIDTGSVIVQVFTFKGGDPKIGIRQTLTKSSGEEIPVKFSGQTLEVSVKISKAIRQLTSKFLPAEK